MDDARRDDVDPTRISVAGTYDHIVGGTDNTPTDRIAVNEFAQRWPGVVENAVENSRFEQRIVRWLAAQGIRQILDLGAGKPKPQPGSNVHEILADQTGDGRVVYVEKDPTAHAQARAMWGSGTRTAYIEADIADTSLVLDEVRDRGLLDLARPVGVLALAVLPYIAVPPAEVIAPYAAAVPSGSVLAITQMSSDGAPAALLEDLREVFAPVGGIYLRPRSEIEAAFQGWPLEDPPGLVDVRGWRPEGEPAERGPLPMLAGVARKP